MEKLQSIIGSIIFLPFWPIMALIALIAYFLLKDLEIEYDKKIEDMTLEENIDALSFKRAVI